MNENNDLLGIAIAITAESQKDKFDKAGKPYILHSLAVMEYCRMYGSKQMQVGVMHDLIEDDPSWNFDRLSKMGFDQDVIDALFLMTHDKNVSYDSYIKGVGTNIMATRAKMGDLKHNSDVTRMKGIRPKDLDRVAKYHRSYNYLRDRLAILENEQRNELDA